MNGNLVKGIAGAGVLMLSALGIMDLFERRETNKKIGMSMKELKDASVKDISQTVVESAVKSAAATSVAEYVSRVKNEVMMEARMKLAEETRKAVKEAGETIQKEVGERISTEASMIDMTALKKSARDKAEEKILDKFDGNLEDLLSKFNDNLSNVQKIYGGIADAITKTKEKDNGIKFTIG